jgi:hypothetical protein
MLHKEGELDKLDDIPFYIVYKISPPPPPPPPPPQYTSLFLICASIGLVSEFKRRRNLIFIFLRGLHKIIENKFKSGPQIVV